MPEKLEELEKVLAELFLAQNELPPLSFSQKLTELITDYPEIFDYALLIPPEDPASFLLLSLEKVFNYSFCYRHPVYKPYIPNNNQELSKCEQVLKKHFPTLRKPLLDFFRSLGREETIVTSTKPEANKQTTVKKEISTGQTEAAQTKTVQNIIEYESEIEINNNTLLELWQMGKRQEKTALDKELPEGFALWLYGIVQDMYRSWFIYQKFQQKGYYKFYIEKREYVLFPEHEIMRIIIGLEYYWVFNRRGVEPDKNLTILQLKDLMQNQINIIYNIFLGLVKPEIADKARENPWFIERIKGTKQAKQVACRYSNYKTDYMIECSDLNAFIQKTIKTEKMPTEKDLEKKAVPVKLHESKDSGFSEKIIWELYAGSKGINPDWPKKLSTKMNPIGREVLKNMRKSFAIYNEFQNSPKRIILVQSLEIQPHHLCIHLLLFIEYFWQLNVLELAPPESLQKYEIDELHRKNIEAVLETMIELLALEHSFFNSRKEQDDVSFNWLYQKLRGAPGANKITISAIQGETQYLSEVSAGSVSVKKTTIKPLLNQ